MTVTQVLWGLISFLFVISFFFVRSWLIKIDKSIAKVETEKTDKSLCNERHGEMRGRTDTLFKHKHSKDGGEVIIP